MPAGWLIAIVEIQTPGIKKLVFLRNPSVHGTAFLCLIFIYLLFCFGSNLVSVKIV